MKKNGFTLVELMIVVTILGILAAIVLPEFQGHAAQSRVSAIKSSIHSVRCQIELYKMHHGNLNPGYISTMAAPTSVLANQFIGTSSSVGAAVASRTTAGVYLYGPYLMALPTNPFNNLSTIKLVPAGVTDFAAVADDSTGWLYQKETATFKINKSGTDSDGVKYADY